MAKEAKVMKKEDCIFYHDEVGCVVFKRCKDRKVKKCSWFHSRKTGYPDYFINHINAVNAINQARAIISQRKFNLLLSIISTMALIIAVISLSIALIPLKKGGVASLFLTFIKSYNIKSFIARHSLINVDYGTVSQNRECWG